MTGQKRKGVIGINSNLIYTSHGKPFSCPFLVWEQRVFKGRKVFAIIFISTNHSTFPKYVQVSTKKDQREQVDELQSIVKLMATHHHSDITTLAFTFRAQLITVAYAGCELGLMTGP